MQLDFRDDPISLMYESSQLSQLMLYTRHTTLSLITWSFSCTNIYLSILVGLKYTFNPYPFNTFLAC